jgi:cyanophycin synthetase
MEPSRVPPSPGIEVLERRALRGPNVYSHSPCILWKIDLGEFEQRPSNTIDGFVERLRRHVPSLVEHHCSEGRRGGFFSRLEDGTWLGHVMEHIALELQSLVGAGTGFGKTRSAGREGVYTVVYEYEEEQTGFLAGEIALEMIHAFAAGEDYPIEEKLSELERVDQESALGPSTRAIVEAASSRGIPHIRLDELNLVQLGYGAAARRIRATIASTTRQIAVEIAGDKDLTKNLLAFHGIPVPRGGTAETLGEARAIVEQIGWPVAVKPLDASQGRGIFTAVDSDELLRDAFDSARRLRRTVVIEEHVEGSDFRLLVVGGRLVAGARRIPAHVIGDGVHDVSALIEAANRDPRRGDGHENVLTKIRADECTRQLLELRGLSLASVPAAGEVVYLKSTANLSTGGTAIDVTDRINPEIAAMAERIARIVELDVAGIDVVATSIEAPLAESGAKVVEVNAAPGFRMHVAPTAGRARDPGGAVVDMLFASGATGRIPLMTVTGTNGKTTTARLSAHIASLTGRTVGLTTTEGIWVGGRCVMEGDTTGPLSAQVVLREPDVELAVLETARGGILRAGLGYDWADVAVVTNISSDHLGDGGIDSIEQLADVKSLTVERVFRDGWAVLNAEEPTLPLLLERANCRVALFSLDPANATFRRHLARGGRAASVEGSWLVIHDQGARTPVCRIDQIPMTFRGRARFNVANALAATLGTYSLGVPVRLIAEGLRSLEPGARASRGRLEFIAVGGVEVVVDYAHNERALAALGEFVSSTSEGRVIGIVGLPGDRRDRDIRDSARAFARHVDELIVREDFDRRDRAEGEVPSLIRAAVQELADAPPVQIVADQRAALERALELARPGDIVVYIADEPDEAERIVRDAAARSRPRQHGRQTG